MDRWAKERLGDVTAWTRGSLSKVLFQKFWLDLCGQRRVNIKSQRQREIALDMGARMSENISDVFMTVYPFSDDIPFLSDKYRIDSNLNTGVYLNKIHILLF